MKLRMSRIVRWRLSIARSTRRTTSSRVLLHELRDVLEREADGVDALDDPVVQVLADPLALVDDRQPLDQLVEPGVLDGDAGVAGERLDEPPGRPRVNSAAPALSVKYRFPTERPFTVTGTPRKLCIGGWFGGNP